MIAAVRDALYASKICSYAQGMNLIRAGSDNWKWDIDLGEMARIWKGGCIIRAQFLDKIKQAYQRRADLPNLLLDPDFNDYIQRAQSELAARRHRRHADRHPRARHVRLASATSTPTAPPTCR